jgi:hypothetical protein
MISTPTLGSASRRSAMGSAPLPSGKPRVQDHHLELQRRGKGSGLPDRFAPSDRFHREFGGTI